MPPPATEPPSRPAIPPPHLWQAQVQLVLPLLVPALQGVQGEGGQGGVLPAPLHRAPAVQITRGGMADGRQDLHVRGGKMRLLF